MEMLDLLKKVLKETENGGRLRTTTRNEVKNLIQKEEYKPDYCPECGAPAPLWAAECSLCGCVWD